jgi:hypothetical protein
MDTATVSIEGHYEAQETPFGNDYMWVPERVLVECSCGNVVVHSSATLICECGTDHTAVVQRVAKHSFTDNIIHPWHPEYEDWLNSNSNRTSTRTVVWAEQIADSLKQEGQWEQRTGESNHVLHSTVDPVYRLAHAIVFGKLDLKHLVIERAIELQDCWFVDEVDSRFCEFKRAVSISECTFHQAFNSGDEFASCTVYRKDLICNRTHFKGAATFNGMRCEGNGYFHETSFENTQEKVDFVGASFQGTLECPDTIFRGRVSFTSASLGNDLDCARAVFRGLASFESVQCERDGFFEDARFESDAGVTLAYASFGELICKGSVFRGTADMRALRCNGSAFFNEAKFMGKEVDFNHASFGLRFICNNASFRSKVSFRAVECGAMASFQNTMFEGKEPTDFQLAHIGDSLDLRYAYVDGTVRMGQTHISQKLRLEGSYFEGGVELYDATIKTLEISDSEWRSVIKAICDTRYSWFADHSFTWKLALSRECLDCAARAVFPFKKRNSLNLTGLTFERFQGNPDRRLEHILAGKLVSDQDPRKFSRDPYLQLEKYYRSNEAEAEAKEIHYNGHCALRRNASDKAGITTWSMRKWMSDSLQKWLIGHGHRAYLLFVPIMVFVILGTALFWADDALRVDPSKHEYSAPVQNSHIGQKLFERTTYSLDLFVPVLDLRYGRMWMVNPPLWREVYAAIHAVAGWVLVAVVLAWLTGIIKTD